MRCVSRHTEHVSRFTFLRTLGGSSRDERFSSRQKHPSPRALELKKNAVRQSNRQCVRRRGISSPRSKISTNLVSNIPPNSLHIWTVQGPALPFELGDENATKDYHCPAVYEEWNDIQFLLSRSMLKWLEFRGVWVEPECTSCKGQQRTTTTRKTLGTIPQSPCPRGDPEWIMGPLSFVGFVHICCCCWHTLQPNTQLCDQGPHSAFSKEAN